MKDMMISQTDTQHHELTPEVALEIIGKECPAEGEGVNLWVYRAACRLVEAGLSDDGESNESILEEFGNEVGDDYLREMIDEIREAQ